MSTYLVECINEFIDKEANTRRRPHSFDSEADQWETSKKRALALMDAGFVRILDADGDPIFTGYPWGEPLEDRFLETAPVPKGSWDRIVACVNIWNDLDAFQASYESWYPYVDHVIAVDGAYSGGSVTKGSSTDGTIEFLESLDKVELIHAPNGDLWPEQVTKRNQYFEAAEEGDLLFVIDADEIIEGAEKLRDLPDFEIGWVPYQKGIYKKAQNVPRIYSAAVNPRYFKRHYWLKGDRGFITDFQEGGPGYDHMFLPIKIDNVTAKENRTPKRKRDWQLIYTAQHARESKFQGDTKPVSGRESLRIVQITSIDPGRVIFRFHSAINSTSPHESVMAASQRDSKYEEPKQWDLREDREVLRRALGECDLVHCHLHYQQLDSLGVPIQAPIVIHHHGSMYRRDYEKFNKWDANKADIRLASNPELMQYGDNFHFLPNPVPVARYRKMRERLYEPDPDGYLRVGHSPTKRKYKGTEDFLEVVESLQKKGLKVRPVLIEDVTHAESIRIKAAECDIFYDSFWLGMQCSGLEAAAMGMPVIAGDEINRAFFDGDTPYIYANDRDTLEEMVALLVTDSEVRSEEGRFIHKYVTDNHDYAAVTKRYLDILDQELDWRDRLLLGGDVFLKSTR